MMKIKQSPELKVMHGCNVLMFIFLIVGSVSGQSSFSKTFDFGYFQTVPYKLLANDSVIVVAGGSLLRELSPERSMFVAQFDLNGNHIAHVNLLDDNDFFTFLNDARRVISVGDLVFVSCRESPFGMPEDQGFDFIASYNITSNEIDYHHLVPAPEDGYVYSRALNLSNDGNLLLLMYTLEENSLSEVRLQKIDPVVKNLVLNEFLFRRDDESFTPGDVISTDDAIVVMGYQRKELDPDYRGLFALKLDESFELQELKSYNGRNYFGSQFSACKDENDNIVFIAKEFTISQNIALYRPLVGKLDEELNVEWEANIGQDSFLPEGITYTGVITSHNNDGFLLCGFGEQEDGTDVSIIAKVSNDGDSVWVKNYIPLDQEVAYSELDDIVLSPDGNYLLTGVVFPTEIIDSVYIQGWLLKVDENGNVYEPGSSTTVVALEDNLITVYPNPASDLVFIESKSLKPIGLSLLDNSGKVVLNYADLQKQDTYYFSTSHLLAGIYYMRAVFSDGTSMTRKIVIGK